MVPSVSSPASSSILGPSAATRIGHGAAPLMSTPACVRIVSPVKSTFRSWMSGRRIDRYSRMWRTGFSNERPMIVSITIWCERPIPSVNRPSHSALAVRACWASISG